jgi:NAD(P)-dependent dehydrogenase (short-subunit alcohol dehydrogenase family)
MRLANRVALITGGGSGIGRAIALAFAREGAKVVIAGRRKNRLETVAHEIRTHCLPVQADVGDAHDITRLVKVAVEHFGGVQVLVNNAASFFTGTAESQTEEQWDQIFSVNVRGAWLLSRAILPHIRAAGGGSIVNMGSIYSLVGARDRVAYSASNGAILALTRAMALDHAAEKIRVNCICPGFVDTEMAAPLNPDENARRTREALHPLGRFGQPEDVAHLALFLASDESAWVTGSAFPIDGGYTAQ